MTKTIAIFGAGTGLGSSVARRFGREGYNVALVGRRVAPLESLSAELSSAGINVRAFPADLSEIDALPGLVAKITEHFGSVDVLEYAPISNLRFHAAKDLTAADLQDYAALYLFAPVQLVQATVTAMIARSEGHAAATIGEFAIELPVGAVLPVVDPDDLAEQYWNLFTTRDRAEQIHPSA